MMKLKDYWRELDGNVFLGNSVDKSYIECPFSFTLSAGKSIGFWIKNNASATQVFLSNSTGNQLIYFESGNVKIKTSTGTVYSSSDSLPIGSLIYLVITITSANVLKVFHNTTEYTIATLASGEEVNFGSTIYVGKELGGIGNIQSPVDDISFWNTELDLNKVQVLYNRSFGLSCNRVPISGLAHYLPLDDLTLENRTTRDYITDIVCTLKGAGFNYFTPNATYHYNSSDYIGVNDTTDWDIDSIETPANDTSKNLTFTFIFNSDVTYTPGSTNLGTLLQFGNDAQSNYFRINIGQGNSTGNYILNLISVSASATYVVSVPPTVTIPKFNAGEWHILSISLSSAGTRFYLNGVKIYETTDAKLPLGLFDIVNLYLGRVNNSPTSFQFYGFMREISILHKTMSDTDLVNLHKSYLGLTSGDTPTGLPNSILANTTYSITSDFTTSEVFMYLKGDRVNDSGIADIKGLKLKDYSTNNRYMNLVNYTFPASPIIARRGNKIF